MMEKILFRIIDFYDTILNAPINYFLFRFKKEFKAVKKIFNSYKLWGNSQLYNIILVDELLNAKKVDSNLAELIFETYFKYMKISRVEAMKRALFTYDKKIFDYYYSN